MKLLKSSEVLFLLFAAGVNAAATRWNGQPQSDSRLPPPLIVGQEESATAPLANGEGTEPQNISDSRLLQLAPGTSCTSTTGGPVSFQKFLSLRLRFAAGGTPDPSLLTSPEISASLPDVVKSAYETLVASCPDDIEGSFRSLDSVTIVDSSPIESSAQLEVLLEIDGVCEGCNPEVLGLFQDTELVVGEAQGADPPTLPTGACFCQAPMLSSFVEALDIALLQSPSLVSSLETDSAEELLATELERCNVALQDPSINLDFLFPELVNLYEVTEFTTFLAVRLDLGDGSTTPSAVELDSLTKALNDAFIDLSGFTRGSCDPLQRKLLSIEVEEVGNGINRRSLQVVSPGLRANKQTGRELQQVQTFPTGVEILLKIQASCTGCDGILFGASNTTAFLPSFADVLQEAQSDAARARLASVGTNCFCPAVIEQSGVSLLSFRDIANGFVSTPIIDAVEVEPVDCPADVERFTTFVLLEYNLKEGAGFPTTNEITTLQNGFVASYNAAARTFCDPFVRRLESTRISQLTNFRDVLEGRPFAIELEVIGTCRGCNPANITLYDPEPLLSPVLDTGARRQMVENAIKTMHIPEDQDPMENEQVSRGLQASTTTCYCDVTAVPGLGPTEVEVISAYSDLVPLLNLPNVESVVDCNVLQVFRTAVIVNVLGDRAKATEEELFAFGQGFVGTYNEFNSGLEFCDRLFRRLTDFEVDADIELNQEFLDAGGLAERRLLTKNRLTRRTQEVIVDTGTLFPTLANETLAPSFANDTFAPSAAPSQDLIPIFFDTSIDILISVTGTCRGCSAEFGLFDQVIDSGRQLQEETPETTEVGLFASQESCFCPIDLEEGAPSEESFLDAFRETVDELTDEGILTFVTEVRALEEVAVVQCAIETKTFEAKLELDFFGDFGSVDGNDLDTVRDSFNSTYNLLTQEYCDPLFRRCRSVEDIEFRQVSEEDEDGLSLIRLSLTIIGECRDCEDGDFLFDTIEDFTGVFSQRNLQEDTQCFCEAQNEGFRPPSGGEFSIVYSQVWDDIVSESPDQLSLVRVESTANTIAPTGVPTTAPTFEPTILPSLAPSSSNQPSTTTPTLSSAPSLDPSDSPTAFPSVFPSSFPSDTFENTNIKEKISGDEDEDEDEGKESISSIDEEMEEMLEEMLGGSMTPAPSSGKEPKRRRRRRLEFG